MGANSNSYELIETEFDKKNNFQFVDYLLELNADPNVQSNRNQRETALMHAATRGMNDIVKVNISLNPSF